MGNDTKEQSDRAATLCEIGIADGIFGGRLSVEATDEGLEFGDGYSTLCWDWILAAFHIIRTEAATTSNSDHGSDTLNRESIIPS